MGGHVPLVAPRVLEPAGALMSTPEAQKRTCGSSSVTSTGRWTAPAGDHGQYFVAGSPAAFIIQIDPAIGDAPVQALDAALLVS